MLWSFRWRIGRFEPNIWRATFIKERWPFYSQCWVKDYEQRYVFWWFFEGNHGRRRKDLSHLEMAWEKRNLWRNFLYICQSKVHLGIFFNWKIKFFGDWWSRNQAINGKSGESSFIEKACPLFRQVILKNWEEYLTFVDSQDWQKKE